MGFGIVNVNSTNPVATVVSQHTLGISAGAAPTPCFTIGYASASTIYIKTNQNVAIEVSSFPSGSVWINVPK